MINDLGVDRQTVRGQGRDSGRRGGLDVAQRHQIVDRLVRQGAPRTGRVGRGAAGQQRWPVLPEPRQAAQPASVLFVRHARGRRHDPRRHRVQRAGPGGHVPHRDAADVGRRPRGRRRWRGRRGRGRRRRGRRRRRDAAAVHDADASAPAPEATDPRRRRHQRLVSFSPVPVSNAERLRRH